MKIAVVAAVSRPERVEHVCANFERQAHAARELVLVLNGPAEHAPAPAQYHVVRTEGGTPARARNAGLAAARDIAQLVSFWDDDDYYGASYLVQAVTHLVSLGHRAVTGKRARYVRTDEGMRCLLGKQFGFLGGTISGWSRELPDIPDLPQGEDHAWCELLAAEGFTLLDLGGLHYIYNRTGSGHAWVGTTVQMSYCFGPSLILPDNFSDADCCRPPHGAGFGPRASLDDVVNELAASHESTLLA